jgi:hypothetical protein
MRVLFGIRAAVVGTLAVAAATSPVASQTIDVVPTMPPAASCAVGTAGDPPASASVTASSPTASAVPDPAVVGVVPPRRATTPEDLPLWRGEWYSPWDRVAIAPRTGAVVTTSPKGPFRTVLWGGTGADGRLLNDGVMIDDSGATRVLPPAPICGRRDFAWLSGSGVVIWGGTDAQGEPLGDGAWYSLDYGTWSLLPPSPLPPGPAIAALNVVLVRDPATGGALVSQLTYPDTTPRWSEPVNVPLPPGDGYEMVCCDGASLLVFSTHEGGFADAAALGLEYPHEGDWTQLGQVPLPAGVGGGPVSRYATERQLTAWIRRSAVPYPGTDFTGPYGLLLRNDRPRQPWHLTAPPPEAAVDDPSLVLSPSHLISAQGMVAYDLMADRWMRLPRRGPSARFSPPEGATAWWNDGRLWVFGGRAQDGSMESRLWTFTPELPRNERALTHRPDLFGYGEGCVAFGTTGTWRLRGSIEDPAVVWTQSGSKRQDTHWPDGWVARFAPKVEIVDTRGRVRYRDGDVCRLDVGTGG